MKPILESKAKLFALSSIDGRYAQKVDVLRPLLSEYGLIHHRFIVEIVWLHILTESTQIQDIPSLSQKAKRVLNKIAASFSQDDALAIKAIEERTQHDVKAVEYFLKQALAKHSELRDLKEFVHFACTSEDINNLAYALMLKKARDQLQEVMHSLILTLARFAKQYAHQPMLARTHGQPASPTTVGKEFVNVLARLEVQYISLKKLKIMGKFNGAVGNYNAHLIAYPEVDWPALGRQLIDRLGLCENAWTTQIEPHDYIAEYCHILIRFNNILIDFTRDMWGYIALEYFSQRLDPDTVGSSTMPHKINPIDFEHAEGHLGLANAVANHLANKLPISRWQRDLSDSTALRHLSVMVAHSLIAYQAVLCGLDKLALNVTRIEKDLEDRWELLSEAVQTVMRRYRQPNAYEQLKAFTRGRVVDQKGLHDFIKGTALPEAVKQMLLNLTPKQYVGHATEQVTCKLKELDL